MESRGRKTRNAGFLILDKIRGMKYSMVFMAKEVKHEHNCPKVVLDLGDRSLHGHNYSVPVSHVGVLQDAPPD